MGKVRLSEGAKVSSCEDNVLPPNHKAFQGPVPAPSLGIFETHHPWWPQSLILITFGHQWHWPPMTLCLARCWSLYGAAFGLKLACDLPV